mgnify:CR=1 FL=1
MNIEQKAWNRVITILDADNFNGFTNEDLIISPPVPIIKVGPINRGRSDWRDYLKN